MSATVPFDLNGVQVEFPKLPLEQCISITARAFEKGRIALVKDLTDAQAAPEARQQALAEYRELEGTHSLLLKYVKSYEGAKDILSTSAKQASIDISNLNLTNGAFVILAARLVGFEPAGEDTTDDNDGFIRKDRPT